MKLVIHRPKDDCNCTAAHQGVAGPHDENCAILGEQVVPLMPATNWSAKAVSEWLYHWLVMYSRRANNKGARIEIVP